MLPFTVLHSIWKVATKRLARPRLRPGMTRALQRELDAIEKRRLATEAEIYARALEAAQAIDLD